MGSGQWYASSPQCVEGGHDSLLYYTFRSHGNEVHRRGVQSGRAPHLPAGRSRMHALSAHSPSAGEGPARSALHRTVRGSGW